MTKDTTEFNERIKEIYSIKPTFLDGNYTKTTHFLLAGLGINPNSNVFKFNFLNAYIDDAAIEHQIKNPVFVLLQTEEFGDKWRRLETILKSIPVFVSEYDVGTHNGKNLVMFAFEFPSMFAFDYIKFLQGEYSKFSAEYRRLFKKEYLNSKGNLTESTIYGVINKTASTKRKIETLIDEHLDPTKEYWEKWTPEREIFRYN